MCNTISNSLTTYTRDYFIFGIIFSFSSLFPSLHLFNIIMCLCASKLCVYTHIMLIHIIFFVSCFYFRQFSSNSLNLLSNPPFIHIIIIIIVVAAVLCRLKFFVIHAKGITCYNESTDIYFFNIKSAVERETSMTITTTTTKERGEGEKSLF